MRTARGGSPADLSALGLRADLRAALATSGGVPGRCVRVDRGTALVQTSAELRRVRSRDLVAGDWVALDGEAVRLRAPRAGEIARRAPGRFGAPQILAAHVDVVMVVCGLDRPVRTGRIRRFLALARSGGAEAVLVLAKRDLHPEPEALADGLSATLGGLRAVTVSAEDGHGLDALSGIAAPDRTMALLGESGAGKSTLANALAGSAQATGAVRSGDGKGRHTTTARPLIPLPGGGALLDTPGLREVGLVDPDGVEEAFADISDLAPGCRFRDCRHESEPGCAVRAAAGAGVVDPSALAQMIAMRREAESAALRADEHERRRHEKRFARVAREAQRRKGRR